MNKRSVNIAIYTGDMSYYTLKSIFSIAEKYREATVMVFIDKRKGPLSKVLRAQLMNLRLNGIYRIQEVFSICCQRLLNGISQNGNIHDEVINYQRLVDNHNRISLCSVENINSKASFKLIKDFQPTIGISIAAPILSKDVLDIAKIENLNLHKGKLPEYRGMPPAFWEVYNGETEVGCSVHTMSEFLDKGDLVCQQLVPIDRYSTPRGLKVRLDEVGVDLMLEAIDKVFDGQSFTKLSYENSKVYTKPPLRLEKELCQKRQCIRDEVFLRQVLKSSAFIFWSFIFGPIKGWLLGFLGRQEVSVLLYHRVNDRDRDSLTVGIEQFDEQMSMINQKFVVSSISSLVTGKVDRTVKKPIVIITFDDGYLDNYHHAYPICAKHGIPASFFVSTENIENNTPFEHDDSSGKKFENMNWRQLNEMKYHGMFIGSHTCSHIRCSDVDDDTLIQEFTKSKLHIESNLQQDIPVLAYPYGGINDFNYQCLQRAKEVGYRAVLSAYGGSNRDIDLANIRRKGIDWKFSLLAVKARIYGWG
ncbi:polysaccharide deacetylase family protein [Thalassotalea maritima]|uniref:polysaccharide deacetylase family protein n=1 Tax=Thalassotalea maritima TaxID=3242416 RepID=UPI003529428C